MDVTKERSMKKIKLLFKGRVKYNTLLLGILSITTIIRLALFPTKNVWIMNLPAAAVMKLFTKTNTIIQKLVYNNDILYISYSIYIIMLILFFLSCFLYIKKKSKAYFILAVIQSVTWGLLIGIANFTAVQFFTNVTGAVAICAPILALVIFFIFNSIKVKNSMNEEKKENE